jgi:hypothetical protein
MSGTQHSGSEAFLMKVSTPTSNPHLVISKPFESNGYASRYVFSQVCFRSGKALEIPPEVFSIIIHFAL